MSNKIHKVSQDLKNQILERVKTSGKSIKEIATEPGITTTCIYNKRGGVKTYKGICGISESPTLYSAGVYESNLGYRFYFHFLEGSVHISSHRDGHFQS